MLPGAVTTGAFRKLLVDLHHTGIRGERGMVMLKSTECFLSMYALYNMSLSDFDLSWCSAAETFSVKCSSCV